jgi:hypothetical protein
MINRVPVARNNQGFLPAAGLEEAVRRVKFEADWRAFHICLLAFPAGIPQNTLNASSHPRRGYQFLLQRHTGPDIAQLAA